jgi:hypothetical protein
MAVSESFCPVSMIIGRSMNLRLANFKNSSPFMSGKSKSRSIRMGRTREICAIACEGESATEIEKSVSRNLVSSLENRWSSSTIRIEFWKTNLPFFRGGLLALSGRKYLSPGVGI